MPRDASGNYTLPPGNPVTPGTIIESDWANPTMSDIAIALTDSLSRNGSGGMLVPFKTADGTMIAPGASWVNEPTSGVYRAGLNDFWWSVGNENILRITKNGIELAPGKSAVNVTQHINVADAEPAELEQGEEWYESDTGGFYMRYVNPDATETLISLATTGGDFIPIAFIGAPNGVPSLDATGKVPASQLPDAVVGQVTSGMMIDFAGAVVPAGWLACDGAAVSRTTFAALFAAIGTAWGVGDGSTTFNVPNLSRRVTVGSGGTGTVTLGNAVGNVGGEENHTLLQSELPPHSHLIDIVVIACTQNGGCNSPGGLTSCMGAPMGLSTLPAGSGVPANVIQPSAVVTKIIKT